MTVLPSGETKALQSRESDADAEMSSSSASEADTLKYNMSEDLEDTPEVDCQRSTNKDRCRSPLPTMTLDTTQLDIVFV
ncbi:hypothetical protein AVEN_91419-1 [Araneus ventricosus]|uniref:Uncharacterized protein n=1 Tax=Araneus ventricosus TaxID=182803 RepID=A0A4Y2IK40_ARAVE|nr:hypothetical protein AVEN_91419-1 [Araneus ventricosus]